MYLSLSPNPALCQHTTCCANPQSQYHHPQLGALKFAQLSAGTFGVCGSPLPGPRAPLHPQHWEGTGVLTLPAPPGSTESKGSLLTMGTIHQQCLTFLLSLQKAPMGVSRANPPHFSRNQSSQVVQSISGSLHLGFAPHSCQLQMHWDNRSLSLSPSPHTRKPPQALPPRGWFT